MLTLSDPFPAASCAPAHGRVPSWNPGEVAILGESDAMQRLRMQVRLLGPHFRIVLLHGEAGTGKELTARALHARSSHGTGRFVRFDCSHRESGAEELMHALQSAHRGTIYLQEIDSMQADTQAFLVSVLERRDRSPTRPIVVHGLEARIVASTIEDLRVTVAAGGFLHELFRRISAVTVELPPLRERMEDIPALARSFIQGFIPRDLVDLDNFQRSTLSQWAEHSWPQNVAELKKTMHEAMEANRIGNPGPQQSEQNRFEMIPGQRDIPAFQNGARLQDVLEHHVFQVLKECCGNKVRAAEVLGISRSTLYRMLEAGGQETSFRG